MLEKKMDLGKEKVSKLLWKFSIPCMISLLISSLYNMVDQVFIGNSELGYLGNASTAVVFPLTIVACAFAWCFGNGAAAFLSLCQGKKDTTSAHQAIGGTMIINLIVSLLLVLIGFLFMDPLLYLFGASEQTISLARDYFTIILAFFPIFMTESTMNAIIRADGSPLYSTLSTLSGAITNIILDPLFIFVWKLGIQGAAIATVIGQTISFVIAVIYFFRTKTFRLCKKSFCLRFSLLQNVVKLGGSTWITQISIVVIYLVCNRSLLKYGAISPYGEDIPIAVMGICTKVFTIVMNLIVGVTLGAQPILGYNIGAKRYDRVKKTFQLVLYFTLIVGVISTLLFEIYPQMIIQIFGKESPLYMEFAVMTFRIYLAFVLFTCMIKLASIFFQAVGAPWKAILISLSRDIVCFVPLALCLPSKMGIQGVLWAAPIADAIGFFLTVILLVLFFRKLGRMQKEEETKEKIS